MKKERLLNAIGQIDDRLISGADPQVHMHRKKIRRQWIAALAACLVLMIGIGVVTPIALGNQEAGKVTMEISPGVEHTITKNGNVKSVRFLNEDAKEVLGEASLKGESLENAISITLAIYKISGYMERNDTVLISFDRQLSENGKLKEVVSDVKSVTIAAGALSTIASIKCSISNATLEFGDVVIVQFKDSDGEWKKVRSDNEYQGEAFGTLPYIDAPFIKLDPSYKAGDRLYFELSGTGRSINAISWTFDGSTQNGVFAELSSGSHTLTATVSYTDGTTDVITATITL